MGLFNGRYGIDKLNRTLIFTALGLNVLGLVLSLISPETLNVAYRILQGVSLVLIVAFFIRAFSRNFAARQKELSTYMRFENWVRGIFTGIKHKSGKVININEHRNYKHLTCPQCMQKLRVPRGKGKILVTCTKCRCKFTAKT